MCSSFLKNSEEVNHNQVKQLDNDGGSGASGSSNSTRAVKTRQESYKTGLGYSTVWQKYSYAQIKKEQKQDPDIGILYNWVENKSRPDLAEVVMQSRAVRYYWHIFDSFKILDGLLVKEFHNKDNFHLQLVTPGKFRKEAMTLAHDNLLSGHLGRKKSVTELFLV
jgi:hypothetical protein